MKKRRELTAEEKKSKKIALILTLVFLCLFLIEIMVTSIIYSFADWIALLLFAILLIFPAYLSNAAMVIVGGGRPIDGGRCFKNGQRILGDHKTWNGLIKGPLYIGIPISFAIFLLLMVLWPFIKLIPDTMIPLNTYFFYKYPFYYEFYFIGGTLPLGILILLIRIILSSYGAAFGDLIGSFIKRRLNYKSGAPFWVVDQLDFALGAILFISIPGLFFPSIFLIPDINILIFIIILTPSVSLLANTIAYMLGLKEVPW
ncbi:MAG: CDP-2,3-bis-(O-geranylgeranyl)-sn-glycerol synthase [Promethearchaeota archaeon]